MRARVTTKTWDLAEDLAEATNAALWLLTVVLIMTEVLS